mmetsp:Transcript_39185/g.106038  ORF Transcript_39185/g.106038 Transcript_39185/m.106038 type:complete len:99 (+) Transcript_39185:837-1133(+)
MKRPRASPSASRSSPPSATASAPRALFVKDSVWFTGAIWGTVVGGWLTAMSVYFAGYLQLLPFILYSLGLLAYLVAMFAMNGHALRESPFRQVAFIFF